MAGRLADHSLAIHGWVYDIGNGDVRIHDRAAGRFVPSDEYVYAGDEALSPAT